MNILLKVCSLVCSNDFFIDIDTGLASSRLVCRLGSQDGRTRFFEELFGWTISIFSSSMAKTRRDDIEKSRSSVRPMSSYGRTIANPGLQEPKCALHDIIAYMVMT